MRSGGQDKSQCRWSLEGKTWGTGFRRLPRQAPNLSALTWAGLQSADIIVVTPVPQHSFLYLGSEFASNSAAPRVSQSLLRKKYRSYIITRTKQKQKENWKISDYFPRNALTSYHTKTWWLKTTGVSLTVPGTRKSDIKGRAGPCSLQAQGENPSELPPASNGSSLQPLPPYSPCLLLCRAVCVPVCFVDSAPPRIQCALPQSWPAKTLFPKKVTFWGLVWWHQLGGSIGNPLQYSCPENPMDRRAWQTTIQRVTKSWTQLKWLSMHTHSTHYNIINKIWSASRNYG